MSALVLLGTRSILHVEPVAAATFLYGLQFVMSFTAASLSSFHIDNPLKTAYQCLQRKNFFFLLFPLHQKMTRNSFKRKKKTSELCWHIEPHTSSPAGSVSKAKTVLKIAWVLWRWCIIGEGWWSFSLCLTARFQGQLLTECIDKSLFQCSDSHEPSVCLFFCVPPLLLNLLSHSCFTP